MYVYIYMRTYTHIQYILIISKPNPSFHSSGALPILPLPQFHGIFLFTYSMSPVNRLHIHGMPPSIGEWGTYQRPHP